MTRGGAGELIKDAHEVELAHRTNLGELVQVQRFLEMLLHMAAELFPAPPKV